MGEQCTVLDELIKNKDTQEFGIHASRNCFGGLLSGKKRVIIVPPPADQKKLFAMTGEKAIDALKQLIIPRPGKSVTLDELAKKGEIVAVNGTAAYVMTKTSVGGAKITKTIPSRNGLIIMVDGMPKSSGTRDVKIAKSSKKVGGKKRKMSGGKKRKISPKKKVVKRKKTGKKRKMSGGKRRMMRGGNITLDITLSNNDLRSQVITVYKNKFGGGYSYPWYYYLYANLLSYLSATESDAYLKYYWLIKMDPYAAVGGFLTPFMKRSYQYYPLSDLVLQKWSRSSWWCNPTVKTGFSYAVYGGMQHDARVLGGQRGGVIITISQYKDRLASAYSQLISWLKSRGASCNKYEKMQKVQEFFKRISAEEGSYAIYEKLPSGERWKGLFYYALYDYVCSRRGEFGNDKSLREIVDRMFSNLEDVFANAEGSLDDVGIQKFINHVGKLIMDDSNKKMAVLRANNKDEFKASDYQIPSGMESVKFGPQNKPSETPSFTASYTPGPSKYSTQHPMLEGPTSVPPTPPQFVTPEMPQRRSDQELADDAIKMAKKGWVRIFQYQLSPKWNPDNDQYFYYPNPYTSYSGSKRKPGDKFQYDYDIAYVAAVKYGIVRYKKHHFVNSWYPGKDSTYVWPSGYSPVTDYKDAMEDIMATLGKNNLGLGGRRGGMQVQIPYSSGVVNADHAWGAYHAGAKKKRRTGGSKRSLKKKAVKKTGKKKSGHKKKSAHKKKMHSTVY